MLESPTSLISPPVCFDVLDRSQSIHRNYLLEASAGTGKTFSIQNIVVRLLIEKPSIPLQKILVVTFTRAATRDLLLRIRTNIEQCLECLVNTDRQDASPDYLQAVMDRGSEAISEAKRALQHALFTFDQASIFTIHSFCSRMLKQYAIESDMGFHASDGIEALPNSELRQVIRDFFRTELHEDLYSPAQMAIVLQKDPRQTKLLKAIRANQEFALLPTYREHFVQFVEVIKNLKDELGLNAECLWQDFEVQITQYNKHPKLTNEERSRWARSFADLFDKTHLEREDFERLISTGLLWPQFFDASLMKKSKAALHLPSLHYPDLNQRLQTELGPVLARASDFSGLLVRLARDCSLLLRRYQSEEERIAPDDLLTKMEAALNQPLFASKVRLEYQAAIIDEFQDTDPLQWSIFKKLFLSEKGLWKGYLYLVGDPKQSIYSFRQADIYTYLAAAQMLGKEHCYTLNVNYRSQPALVQALNTLFDPKHLPEFMPLPKKNGQLPYTPVTASPGNQPFRDLREALHFFAADASTKQKSKLEDFERDVFFPFIVQEITRLRKQNHFNYQQFAVLVRDQYQAQRLTEFFQTCAIPFLNQKGMSLTNSPSLNSFIDLVRAVLHLHDRSAVKTALGSFLIGWTCTELQNITSYDEVLLQIQKLRLILIEEGFSPFFEKLLQSVWKGDGISFQDRLLNQQQGLEFFHDLQQIADLIIEHQFNGWNTPEGIISFLDHLDEWAEDESEKVMRLQDPNKNGVKVITMHYSKGLEFDVVFALGLIKRDTTATYFIPTDNHGMVLQIPVNTESSEYAEHCQEKDAEKMRQLYVALTRAKYQLYVPVILHQSSTALDLGEASPLDLLLGRLLQPTIDYKGLYERIQQGHGSGFIDFLESAGKENHITYSVHQAMEKATTPNEVRERVISMPPRRVNVSGESLIISSFTGLNRHQEPNKADNQQEHLLPPHDFEAVHKHVHTIPSSSDTGVFIHEIMEKIPFSTWKEFTHPEGSFDFLKPYLVHPLFKNWAHPLTHLIYDTLKTDLDIPGTSFCLADLQSIHLYREMPFLYPCKGVPAIEELMHEQGLIKGIIDLIFIFEDQYYLVDWKTNWLGNDLQAYERPRLYQAMQENGYFLQAEIYKEALRRYLRLVERRPFEECFGGTYYLFMRGMVPGSKTGIYKVES